MNRVHISTPFYIELRSSRTFSSGSARPIKTVNSDSQPAPLKRPHLSQWMDRTGSALQTVAKKTCTAEPKQMVSLRPPPPQPTASLSRNSLDKPHKYLLCDEYKHTKPSPDCKAMAFITGKVGIRILRDFFMAWGADRMKMKRSQGDVQLHMLILQLHLRTFAAVVVFLGLFFPLYFPVLVSFFLIQQSAFFHSFSPPVLLFWQQPWQTITMSEGLSWCVDYVGKKL